jgi:pyruvate/2-oxoglutarate/acetoin dehydrogenase E1 component
MAAPVTYSRAYRDALKEEMIRDETIFYLGTDMVMLGGHFGQVTGLGAEFGPERIRDTPISECAIVAAGVGAALSGMRPIADVNFVDFAFGAMDEIVNQAAKIRFMLRMPLPLVIRASIGAGKYGAPHNNFIETWFTHMPGLLVVVPSTPNDVAGLLRTALRGEDPVMFLTHKLLTGARGVVEDGDKPIPFGKAAVRREGDDVTIVGYSSSAPLSLRAAEELEKVGVSAEVIDLRTLVPLDLETVEASVRKTHRLVLVEEGFRFCGFMAEVASSIQESSGTELLRPIVRVGALHAPIPHSPTLIAAVTPQVDDVVHGALRAAGRN